MSNLFPLTELIEIHDYLREPVSQSIRNKRQGKYPYYGATGQVGWIDEFRQDGEFVLLGEDGAPFLDPLKPKAYRVSGKCWVNNHAHVIRGKEGICDNDYLCYALNWADYSKAVAGSTRLKLPQNTMHLLEIPAPEIGLQRSIASHLKAQLAAVEEARSAAQAQLAELTSLANAIIRQSVEQHDTSPESLGEVLDEVKAGIGPTWADYPVLGATRAGLALAKEPVGKQPQRYKPVFSGTVFYNPMRILIGSIALVDEDDTPGITSPDYVALRGKLGRVDSRWFYFWLRSPYGERCIASLARGAVRERMLFNRLAEGKIALPPYDVQVVASQALAELKPMRSAIETQLKEINQLPGKILAKAFDFGA
jgi:type I restriction enzyme S subunit